METEREPLIPGPMGIHLPQIDIDVGKWFWLGLAMLVLAIGFSIAACNGWGPHNPFDQPGLLGETPGGMALLMAHPNIGWPFLYAFGLVSPGQIIIASIVLLWIAFARPSSPDRVAFVPAVTVTAWVFASLAAWIFGVFSHGDGIFGDVGLVSYAATISLVGCASITLAARGLRRLPRAIVWTLCALAFSLDVMFEAFAGTSPTLVAGSLFLGMAVLAFGFEVAEQSGADIFVFDDDITRRPAARIRHLRIVEYVLLGSAGVVVCMAIGYALVRGTIHSPFGEGVPFGGHVGIGLMDASYSAATTIGSALLWASIATLALWVAFVRPERAERLLFASGTILGAAFLFPNIDGFLRLAERVSGLAVISAVAGYPSLETAYSIAGGLALFIAARGVETGWRRPIKTVGVVVPACVLVGFFVAGVSPLDLVGGIILGVSGPVLALAIARRAGVDPFRQWT